MILGEVVGSIWATQKEEGMSHLKLLLIQPISHTGDRVGSTVIAADRIGAGQGEKVIISRGSPARSLLNKTTPVDAIVVAIVDSLEVIEE